MRARVGVSVWVWCSEHALRDCAPESESRLGKMLRPAVPTCWSKSDELTFPWLIPERRCLCAYIRLLQAQTTHKVEQSLSLLLFLVLYVQTLVWSCFRRTHNVPVSHFKICEYNLLMPNFTVHWKNQFYHFW